MFFPTPLAIRRVIRSAVLAGMIVGCIPAYDAYATGIVVSRNGPELTVNSLTAGLQMNPSVATLGIGEFVVVWSGRRSEEDVTAAIWARRFNRLGADGDERIVGQVTDTAPSIFPHIASTDNGRSLIAWMDEETP